MNEILIKVEIFSKKLRAHFFLISPFSVLIFDRTGCFEVGWSSLITRPHFTDWAKCLINSIINQWPIQQLLHLIVWQIYYRHFLKQKQSEYVHSNSNNKLNELSIWFCIYIFVIDDNTIVYVIFINSMIVEHTPTEIWIVFTNVFIVITTAFSKIHVLMNVRP